MPSLPWFAALAGACISSLVVRSGRRRREGPRALRRRLAASERLSAELRRQLDSLSERLDAQADFHTMTLQSIADAVITTDPDGCVQAMNAMAEAWTGWRTAEARGQPLERVFGIVDGATGSDLATRLRRDLAAGRATSRDRESLLTSRDGSSRYVNHSSVPIVFHDGRHLGAVLTFRDITARREAVAAQQQLLDAARDAETAARRSESELAVAHEKFAAFMANFPYPAFIQDARGEFVFLNAAAQASAAWREAATRTQGATTDSASQTVSLAADDRHYFTIRFPLDVEGRQWLGGIAIDVSERVRAERSLSERTAEFETLFHNAPVPLWIARDSQGREILGNAAADELIGLPRGANASMEAGAGWRLLHEARTIDVDALPLHVAMRERTLVPAVDLQLVRPDGSTRHVRMTAAPLLDAEGGVRGGVAAGLDISQLKAYESELERAVRRRDEFLAVLAHELRNPLAPIRNSVQILQRAPEDLQRVRRATATIDRQTSLLVRLIDDLLDVARISQGLVELDIAPRPVAAVVEGAVEAVRASAESTGHAIAVEHGSMGAMVQVDGLRAEQVLVNLLSNALKYSLPRTRVLVRSWIAEDEARIAVTDQGQGIAPEFLCEIFTMFARPGLDAKSRVSGMGVGLALAKQLCEQQGGRIEAASEGRGRGATFTVSFPLARAAENVAA